MSGGYFYYLYLNLLFIIVDIGVIDWKGWVIDDLILKIMFWK